MVTNSHTVKKRVGEAVYDSWPTGATKAIELLEYEESIIRSLIEDAMTQTKVRRNKYLNEAIAIIDGERDLVSGVGIQGIIPKKKKRKKHDSKKEKK